MEGYTGREQKWHVSTLVVCMVSYAVLNRKGKGDLNTDLMVVYVPFNTLLVRRIKKDK